MMSDDSENCLEKISEWEGCCGEGAMLSPRSSTLTKDPQEFNKGY